MRIPYEGTLIDAFVVVEEVSTEFVSSFMVDSSIISIVLLHVSALLSFSSIKSFLRSLRGGVTLFILSIGDRITVPVYL